MTNPDSWKTPALREAEAKLNAAMADLDQRIDHAKEVERTVPKSNLSGDEIRQIEEFAHGKDAPEELRELQQRIDRGELTWDQIGDGEHLDDPAVRAALERSVPGLSRAYTSIIEGEHLDDIIEAGTARPASPRDHFDGDSDGEGGGGFMKRGW